MRVRCTSNRIDSLSEASIQEHVKQSVHLESVDLHIGKDYQVFGVSFDEGIPWFLICEDMADNYPVPHCSAFFELIEGTIDSGWMLSIGESNVGSVSLLPAGWATDKFFLEKLVDGDSAAIAYFDSLKGRT